MDPTVDPVYFARKQDDGTWSIVDSQTGLTGFDLCNDAAVSREHCSGFFAA
ncbi:hypothetical protein [Rhizobium sp. SYY.PMSO]|uniref:hypothetical protein n=1 Tax=Rhizobium sp. SYY.PMSO TaxID=3382192 RepID=UPI00398FE974